MEGRKLYKLMPALVFHNSSAKKEMKKLQKTRLQEHEGTEDTKTGFFMGKVREGDGWNPGGRHI